MTDFKNIYQFKVRGLTSGEINFADYKGKKIMIVNVASECGFTPQYQQLQELHEQCGDRIQIIAFPCNDFGQQEPAEPQDIQQFCATRYKVSFPLAEKVNIKGTDPHPIYQWLTRKELNGVLNSEVEWNFQKYLIDEKGQLLKSCPPAMSPIDESILHWVMN
ncbi:MAG TPA: glutathione peroxidase [Phaeodactylibacter sp.]|nr:glutathione peroxidase [Phaeodactylibacter sp.]